MTETTTTTNATPPPRKRLAVTPTDDWLTFKVESETEPGKLHHVDLEQLPVKVNYPDRVVESANGWCDCDHFRYRLCRKAENGHVARCKHIVAAMNYTYDLILEGALVRRREAIKAAAPRT